MGDEHKRTGNSGNVFLTLDGFTAHEDALKDFDL